MKLPDQKEDSPEAVYFETQRTIYSLNLTPSQLQDRLADINPVLAPFLISYINGSEVSSSNERNRHLEQALIREAAQAIISPARLGIDPSGKAELLKAAKNNVRPIRPNMTDQLALPPPRLAKIR